VKKSDGGKREKEEEERVEDCRGLPREGSDFLGIG
jgi:hypothetical protein